jgi:hypothetical protein
VEPVVAGFEHQARRHLNGFVTGAADLEEDAALVSQLDFFVVEHAGAHHATERVEQLAAGQTVDRELARPARRRSR